MRLGRRAEGIGAAAVAPILSAALLLGLTLPAAGASAAGGADVGLCPVRDLVPPIACRDGGTRPGATSAQAAADVPEPDQDQNQDQVRRTSTTVRRDPDRISVTFERGVSQSKRNAVFARAGVTVEQAIPALRAFMVGVEPSRLDAALGSLRDSPEVASAAQEILADALDVAPNDTDWAQQWGLRVTRIPQAWSLVKGAKPVVVAVIDTGVDPAQPDLAGAVVAGRDFVHQTPNPLDDHGHGTAVAGIIAARIDNREGIAGICGTCLIMPVKVLDSTGVGDDSVIAAGIVWAVDHGAKVINLSLGAPGTTPALDDAVAYAVRKGALVVAAAGNSSSTVPFYPAASPQALGVAATTESDRPYSWSNSGSWVKLAAPGCNPAPVLKGGYGTFCGTSSATPVVAGLAALSLTGTPNADPQQLEQALAKAAVPIPGFVQYGRIDAPGTLSNLTPPPPPPPAATTVVINGTLTARARELSYTRTIQAGRVISTLKFKGARAVTLTLIPQDPAGETVRVAGPSPLRIERVLPAGTIRFVVRGDLTTTAFTLTITNRPAAATG
jgi:subtilisin family serine protease